MIKTRLIAYRYATGSGSGSGGGSNGNNFILLLEVTQKGKPILNPTEDTVKGPIRLRFVSSSSLSSSSSPSSSLSSQKSQSQVQQNCDEQQE
jgi:hypothetical protein